MPKILLLLLVATLTALGADDPWANVRQLKSGVELRIFKKGAVEPMAAKFDEVREDTLSVVVKNAQLAIPKDAIDRVDWRPPKVVKRTPGGLSVVSTEFKTVYRRPPAPEKKP